MMKWLARLMVTLLLVAPPAAFADVGSPTERVREAVDLILAVVTDQRMDADTRQRRVRGIIDNRFDFQSMSQSVLATHWRRAAPEERQQFVAFFSQYLENIYLDAIKSYTDERIEYTGEKIRGDRATVDTEIVSGGTRTPVSYRMRANNGQWYAYDVVIENVSLVSNYRSTFASIIQTDGISGLLGDLQGRIKKYKQDSNEHSGSRRPY